MTIPTIPTTSNVTIGPVTIRGAIANLLNERHRTVLWMAFSMFCMLMGMGIANGWATYSAVQDAWQKCGHIRHQALLEKEGYLPNPGPKK